MSVDLDVQLAGEFGSLPTFDEFLRWVTVALQGRTPAELTVRIVAEDESRALNGRYRGKETETNVLSFPAELPEGIDLPLLGDIVICAPVVAAEAAAQGKPEKAHWAHLTVHGVLHLLGYDHQHEAEAGVMESLEIRLLESLGFPNPYVTES